MFVSKKKYAALANQFEETRRLNAILNDTVDSWVQRCEHLEEALKQRMEKDEQHEEQV